MLFLLLLLSKNWKGDPSKQVLAFMLVSFLLILPAYSLIYFYDHPAVSIIRVAGLSVPAALGPLFCQYIQSIYQLNFKLDFRFYQKLLPFTILMISFSVIYLYFGDWEATVLFPLTIALTIFSLGHLIYNLWRGFQHLKNYRKELEDNYASFSELDLQWLTLWAKGLSLIVILDFIVGGAMVINEDLYQLAILNEAYIVGLLWYVGYYGLQQGRVWLYFKDEKSESPTLPSSPLNIIENDQLNDSGLEAEKLQIKHAFECDAIYRNPTLSLKSTAEHLKISPRRLSNILNTEFQQSFFEFVNYYRVQDFQQRVKNGDDKNLTLLALAYESGFNSKASFNRIFKQQEGLTPTAWKSKHTASV